MTEVFALKILNDNKENKSVVKIKLSEKETVNKFDYGIISSGTYSTLSRVNQMQFDGDKTLVYHVSSEKNLEEWLTEKHSEFEFTSILSSSAKTFADIVDSGLTLENILYDSKYIFISQKNKTIEFLYVPLDNHKSTVTPYDFILDFIKRVDFHVGESPTYLPELISFVSAKDFSFRKFKDKVDEICGKSVREEHKVIFDSSDENSKRKTNKKGEVFLKDIPGGTNAMPLQKKIKVEPGQINANEKDPNQQFQPHYRPNGDIYDSKSKTDSKNNDQNNRNDSYSPRGYIIPEVPAASFKKNKVSKKAAKKKAYASQARIDTSTGGNFAIPGDSSKAENYNILGDSAVSNSLPKKEKTEKHGFNLTEMLINFIKRRKEKKNKEKLEVDHKGKQKKEKKEKKEKGNVVSDFDVPVNSSRKVNTKSDLNNKYTEEAKEPKDCDNLNSKSKLSNDRLNSESVIERSDEIDRIEGERAKLEKEKAEHEEKIKEAEKAQNLEIEKQKEAMKAALRKDEARRNEEEKRLKAERDRIAKEKEAQQKEALRISEEKKNLEAERAKFEEEMANKKLNEQKKSKEQGVSKEAREDIHNSNDDMLPKNDKSKADLSNEKNEGNDPTVLLAGNNYAAYLCPKLVRVKTNETVSISKSAYRIGKEKSNVDYCISNNSAISRLHAIIYCKEGRYYIVDTLSTNHTFVNGKIITSNQNYELLSGDVITLANEDFDFIV